MAYCSGEPGVGAPLESSLMTIVEDVRGFFSGKNVTGQR